MANLIDIRRRIRSVKSTQQITRAMKFVAAAKLRKAQYFLIVKDIVDFCQKEGIPCVGRGSAGDSVVSYVLGITQVDPLRYKLYFERFLNPEHTDPPDIDLDLCWKNRDRMLEYVFKKYGEERTAMICT